MIVLFTGVPGSGKTSKVVSDLAKIKDRPIFAMGIPELKIPHQPVPPVAEWTRLEPSPEDAQVKRPVFNFPPNALIVIDEAQNVYRPRASGSKVPDIVAAFETHRHTGVDFWLITQHPTLLDSNIRKLVGKHLHVHVAPLGRKLLEWAQCRDPDSKTDRGDAIRIDYKPDKKIFDLYKSAEAHTVIKRRLSKSVMLLVACLVLLPIGGVYVYKRVSAKLERPEVSTQGVGGKVAAAGPVVPVKGSSGGQEKTVDQVITQFQPLHPNFPESAPAYDALRIVKSMPVVAGCVKTKDWCRCYSQQGTKLEIQADRCSDIIGNKVFDPYREPIQVASSVGSSELHRPVSAGDRPGLKADIR
jgi:zona occludens toxin